MPAPDADTLRILVASDIHIGYGEKDAVRGNDSFNSFEEVLQVAKERQVDMVLLGGDLFHENKPSPKCLIRTTELLRKYCLGDDPVQIQLVSDQNENFSHTTVFPFVNFEDANLNVSMPVFTIHGNHDDPTGRNPVCYLEALSASGLINYFGKYVNMDHIVVRPLLLVKGRAKLALFGLGSLPEERLHRFFLHNKIKFMQPLEHRQEWFKIMVVHQNRVPHGTKYLPEKFLGTFPDLVVWGHEHESKTLLDKNDEMGFYVLQPGSTVATSLCPGEAGPKNIAIVEIEFDAKTNAPTMTHEAVPLRSVRQFLFESVDLDEELGIRIISDPPSVEKYCIEKVQSMIDSAQIDHTGDPVQPKLPLIRLRIECSHALPFTMYQFGLQFKGKVANPNELLLFKLKRKARQKAGEVNIDSEKLQSLLDDGDGQEKCNIEDIVEEMLNDPSGKCQPLALVSERHLTKAVRDMVEKETDNVDQVLDDLLGGTRRRLVAMTDLNFDNKDDIVDAVKAMRSKVREKEQSDKKRVAEGMSQLSQPSQSSSSGTSASAGDRRSRDGNGPDSAVSDDETAMQVEDDDIEGIEDVSVDSEEEDNRRLRAKAASRGRGRKRT